MTLQQEIADLRARLAVCQTDAECQAIERELDQIQRAHRRQRRRSQNPSRKGECLLRVYYEGWFGSSPTDLYVVHDQSGMIKLVVQERGGDTEKIAALGYDPHTALDLVVSRKEYTRLRALATPAAAAADNPAPGIGERVALPDGRKGVVESVLRGTAWVRLDGGALIGYPQADLRAGNPSKGRKAARRAPPREATLCVALVGPGQTTYHVVHGERVGEHLVIHPSVRTPHEVYEADGGEPHSWAVTHVPTGQLVATVRTKAWAKRLAKQIDDFSGAGIASAHTDDVQVAIGGPDMQRAQYIEHVARQSFETPAQRGKFPTYKAWLKHAHELNPDDDRENRKTRAAVHAALGSLVGGLVGIVVGAVGGGALGLVIGGLAGGAEGAAGGAMIGGAFGVPIGGYVGTIWGAVRQTGKALHGVDAGTAKVAAGVGSAIFGPIGAGVGGYLGA